MMALRIFAIRFSVGVTAFCCFPAPLLWADEEEVQATAQVIELHSENGTIRQVYSTVPGQGVPQPAQVQPGVPPGQPGAAGTPGNPGEPPPQGKPDEKAAGEQKPGEGGKPDEGKSAPVKRSEKPTEPPNPEELKARPDEAGLVTFQFRGQSWPDVMEWLGEISSQSVDWQELPGDYVNLATPRGYTIDETRDLLNRLLLARGYTLLEHQGFLTVVKCEGISVGLVPRVARDDLETRQPHEFCRVMFSLDWMLAEEAAKEFEPLISKNGKMFPLKMTNRLEVVDAVANLRQVDKLLREEQSDTLEEPRLVHEFVLRHTRAAEVREELQQFLGISSSSAASARPMTPQEMAQQQQMLAMQAQQQQQQRQQGGVPAPVAKSKEAPVRLMVNKRRNSILVQAPPDKMAIVEDAIRLLDVPSDQPQSLQGFLGRMQTYRLSQLDPQKLATSLLELGCLDPTTRLEVDTENRAIIAFASPADHFTIQSTVEKLDGSARQIEVIQLKKMPADEVAGTIEYLMNGSREDSSRRSYNDYYSPWGSSRRNSRQENDDSFRVDADIVNNRLLVRANDVELEEVVSILVKMGEIPQPGGSQSLTRVLDVFPGEDADTFLRELEQSWKLLAPNPLVIPQRVRQQENTSKETPEDAEEQPAAVESAPAAATETNEPTAGPPRTQRRLFHPALFQLPTEIPAEEWSPRPTDEHPIMVTVGPDGRLVLASKDPRALDLLEELAARSRPA